ncbi:MAG: dihydroorotase [Vicingaceae bacterium]
MKKKTNPDLFTISDVKIWNPDEIIENGMVIVENGKVKSVYKNSDGQTEGEIYNGNGLVLMPSGVDAHVHLRVPGQAHKETPITGLHAAIKGGYGAVLNMPNTRPPIDSVDVCEMAMTELKPALEETGVKVFLSACITKGMQGKELVDVDSLAKWGVKTFTDDGLGVESDEIMREAFAKISKWNIPVSQHAEYCGHGGVLAGGRLQRQQKIPRYPISAEYDMVARDIRELRKHPKARYHVLHVSLGKTVQLVMDARLEGLKVSCEVTPHHLHFTYNEIKKGETSFKMNPPLRDGYDRHVLIKALQSGDVGFVATDHAPHASEEKGENFEKAAFGTTGMETSLRVLISMLQRGELTARRLVEVYSTAPSIYLGIEDEFGSITAGKPFNAILVDVDHLPVEIEDRDLLSKSKNNVFKGVQLPGQIQHFFNPLFQFELI